MIIKKLADFDFTKPSMDNTLDEMKVGEIFYVSGKTIKVRARAFYHAKKTRRRIATMRVLAGMKLGKFVAPEDGIAVKRIN